MNMESKETYPRVGVGVMILKENKVLLSKRKNAHGQGCYSFPGGHVEYMESFEECAKREIAEECGIEITNIRFQYLANLRVFAPKHYIQIGLVADWISGEPQVLEPEKNEEWIWYALDSLPGPVFETVRLAMEAHQTGMNYKDNALPSKESSIS